MKNKYAINTLAFLAFLFIPVLMRSQVVFSRLYPTNYDKTSREVLPTSDGGYLIVGMTNNSDFFDNNAYIIKTDNTGLMQWEKIYGGAKPDYPYSAIETTDGSFMITGFTQSFGGGDMDVYLLKIDASGNKVFEKTLGSTGNEEAREIVKTADGNYVIVGSSSGFSGNQDAFLIKIDNAGAELWRKTYGGAGKEFGNGVAECSDGGFILTGQTFSQGSNGLTYLVRTNSTGVETWSSFYGTSPGQEGVAVVANTDGSYVVAVRDSTAAKDIDVIVMKTDAAGVKMWEKIYGGTDKDTPKRIRATSDGGYIVGAISRSFGWINPDIWLLKLDAGGNNTWTQNIGISGHEHCHDIKQSSDGGYLVAGHSRSYSPYTQVYFLKLNSSGTVAVPEVAMEDGIEVYPNPTNGLLSIRITSEMKLTGLSVSNMMGQVVYSKNNDELKSGKIRSIDLSGRPVGVYFLSLSSGDAVSTRKIILR